MKLGVADIILGIPFLHALHPQINWANCMICPLVSTSPALPSISSMILSIEVVTPKPSVPVEYKDFADVFDKKLATSYLHTGPLTTPSHWSRERSRRLVQYIVFLLQSKRL